MIVVADTTPINYLVLIQHIDLLRIFYGEILIPHAVHYELLAPNTPPQVKAWATDLPAWVKPVAAPVHTMSSVSGLDAGETEAIALALDRQATWLLIDESAGRQEASRLGLQIVGTLAVLIRAHDRGLLDFRTSLQQLEDFNFHISPSLRLTLLDSL